MLTYMLNCKYYLEKWQSLCQQMVFNVDQTDQNSTLIKDA